MRIFLSIALAALAALAARGEPLTREEIIARFRASPVTKVSGLLQVIADCPADLRREFQGPVSTFASDICNDLYRARMVQPAVFSEPGIIIYIGSSRTNDTSVVVRPSKREDGSSVTRIFLPSPASSDLDRLRTEVARAFSRCVDGKEVTDEEADEMLLDADPARKVDRKYELIEMWERGEKVPKTDEEMIALCRAVLSPGVARESDVLRFGARLRLYPESFDRPFCGKFRSVDFADAIKFRNADPRIRFIAYAKTQSIVLFGGGRGEKLSDAAAAYAEFLLEIARNTLDDEKLKDLLEAADVKYEIALEEARKSDSERKKK